MPRNSLITESPTLIAKMRLGKMGAMKTKIPPFIFCTPSDDGKDDNDPEEWAWIVLHEIDLYEEDEESDIKTRAQYRTAKRCLDSLRAEAAAAKPQPPPA